MALRKVLLTCGMVLVGSLPLVALQPVQVPFDWQEQVPKYTVRHFTTEDGLPVNAIHSVLSHPDGYLYMGTYDGLVRYDGHRFKVYNTANTPSLQRNRIVDILQAPEGVWVTDSSYHLYLFKEGRFIPYQKNIHEDGVQVYEIQKDRQNRLIVFTNMGAWRHSAATDFTRLDSISYTNTDNSIQESKFAVPLGKPIQIPEGLTINGQSVFHIAIDEQVTRDHEGNYWMPTVRNGIYKGTPQKMITIGKELYYGLFNIYGMYDDSAKSVWANSMNHGVFRFKDEILTVWSPYENTLPSKTMRTLTRLDNGVVYAGGRGGIWKFNDSRWELVSDRLLRVDVLFQDSKQRFWAGSNQGLYRVRENEVLEFSDQVDNTIQQSKAIKEVSDGTLVFATSGQGIALLDQNTFQFITTEQGLSSNFFRDLYLVSKDTLWAVSEDLGLNRVVLNDNFSVEEVKVVTTEDGLIDNSLHRLIEDSYGYFWINSNSGIMRIREEVLNNYLDGNITELPLNYYTSSGGELVASEGNGGAQYAGVLTPDGKLLFPSQAGIVYTRPEWHLNSGIKKLAKPRAERLMFSDSTIALAGKSNARLPKAARDIQIKFTLPTFSYPDRLTLEYKMEGINDRWNRVGTDRLATFTNLPGGEHTFMMRGKMPSQTSYSRAAITIVIPPMFYETGWFIGLLVLGLAGLILGIIITLQKRAKRREEQLNKLIDQRTREVVEEKEKTELALERLQKLDESKSRFFANFTHELRTPLSLILNPLKEMLEKEPESQENGTEDLAMMQRNARRLKDLVNRLLDVSRLNSGELLLTFQPVDIDQLTKRISSQFEHSFSRKGIRFSIEADEQVPDLYLDVGAWEDITTNLLGNSLKFTDEGGEVIVQMRNNSNTVEISFRDSGLGIPEEDQPYIFDQYYQGDSTISKAGGTGIGLALVKGLVERMGGEITLNSDLEKGTEFIISLKKGTDHFDSADEIIEKRRSLDHEITSSLYIIEEIEPELRDEQAKGSHKVLLVEDNEDFRGYLHNVIQREYRVRAASNGKEGLEILDHYHPDIIVSDIMMPEMDGYEMMQEIRGLEAYRHIPFIFLSAKDSPYDIEVGLNSGADIYLTKPVENNVLLTQIKVLLRREEYLRDSEKEAETSGNPFVQKVRKIIQRHLGNSDLSSELIANLLSVSKATLYRRWNKGSEETINQVINSMRIEEALQLIEDDGLTISEAAYATGYNHPTYFSRVFKKVYGMTPQEYLDE